MAHTTFGADRKILLIVEDDNVLAKNLSTFFRDAGFTVLQANDGESGLETAVKEKPDIILLDIIMPKMDGLTMLQKLRHEHSTLKIPVIILTHLDANDMIIREITTHLPSYYILKKEAQLDDILEKVKNILESSRV